MTLRDVLDMPLADILGPVILLHVVVYGTLGIVVLVWWLRKRWRDRAYERRVQIEKKPQRKFLSTALRGSAYRFRPLFPEEV